MRCTCIMKRTELEKEYWDSNALDPEVDEKYIADVPVEDCKADLGELSGEVLEIGCGVGRLMEDGWFGVDTSENMIKIARERNPKLNLFPGDGRTLPHDDNQFDFVYCYLVFQHLPFDAVKGYAKEAARILKDGGTFIFQWIEGTEDEPFSKHLNKKQIETITKPFKKVTTTKSKAYSGWNITRCVK